jgi:hypothetical protein
VHGLSLSSRRRLIRRIPPIASRAPEELLVDLRETPVFAVISGLVNTSLILAFAAVPTFYQDVLPILRKRCLECHSAGAIAPMSFTTYEDSRPWAAAMRESVKLRRMPPWFADSRFGEFANDPRLTDDEIAVIEAWSRSGASRGSAGPRVTAQAREQRLIHDLIVRMPRPFRVPGGAIVDYQYVLLPERFDRDQWVREVEIRPGERRLVHHAVLFIRHPRSDWLREARPGVPFAPAGNARVRSRQTKEDILAIYTPGAAVTRFPEGMAKRIPAGGELILQLHYTSGKTDMADQTEVRLRLRETVPDKQIITLQMGRDDLRIPPGERHYRASVSGTLPQDALLISLFPHMHLRGSAFDFDIVGPGGSVEPLLRVKPFDFYWQLSYVLKKPRLLAKGTILRWTGYFDNSANNPRNPDPSAEVTWGEQSSDEMMIGFFDVAVDPHITKEEFFVRR